MSPQSIPQFPRPAFRSHIEILITFYTDLAQRSLEATQSLSELNLQLARDLIAEAGLNTQRLMASRDAAQLGLAISAQLAPSHALGNYQQRFTEILSRANSTMAQTAATHMPAMRSSATTLTEEIVQEAKQQVTRAGEKMAQFHPASQVRH